MRLAIVIGAGGRIGSAIASHLGRAGYDVRAPGRSELDLNLLASIRGYLSVVPRIDVLVNAAGSYGAIGRVRDLAPETWRRGLEVNLAGVYAACHYALPRMVRGGRIINIAGGGKGPMEYRSAYATSKSGLWRLTETLAAEEPELHVNAIAPGPMWSRMQEAIADRLEPWAAFVRELKHGRGEVSVDNTLRCVDYLLDSHRTGQLLFARDFPAKAEAAAA